MMSNPGLGEPDNMSEYERIRFVIFSFNNWFLFWSYY